MNAIWVLTVLAVASADVSHLGYNYKVPQTSYGFPSYQYSSGQYNYNPSYAGQYHSGSGISLKGSQGQYLGSTYSQQSGFSGLGDASTSASNVNGGLSSLGTVFGSGLVNGLSSGSNNRYNTVYNSGLGYGLNSLNSGPYYYSVNSVPNNVQPIYLGGSNQYQYASNEKYQQYVQVHQQPAQVFKHFYVHAAPEEPEPVRPRTPIVLPPSQKHYKIIFVKTPQLASRSQQIVPVQPQNEEKTIVYVLVKKPEEQQEVIVPKVEQKPPSKPEVYFIKYNNKEDDKAVINNIVNDYNKDGQSVSFSTGEGDGFSSGSSFSDVPTVTNFSNFPSGSSSFATVPNGVSFESIPSGSAFTGTPSGASFSTVSSGPSFSTVSSGPTFATVPGPSFSTGPTVTSFSNFPASSSFSSFSNGPSITTSGGSNVFEVPASSGSFSSVSSESQVPISSFGSQSFGVSDVNPVTVSTFDAGVSGSTPQVITSVTSKPVVSSTISTVSNVGYDDLNTISTSQGIPHETYGPPKFRVN